MSKDLKAGESEPCGYREKSIPGTVTAWRKALRQECANMSKYSEDTSGVEVMVKEGLRGEIGDEMKRPDHAGSSKSQE